MEMFIK